MRHMEPPEAYQERLALSLDYMESHLGSDFSLEEMAWHACLSPFHFHRIFHKLVGRTPGEHLRRRRLDSAARALLGCDLPMKEIAQLYGYISLQGFMRAFREQFFATPAQYRELGLPLLLDQPFELRLDRKTPSPTFSAPVTTLSPERHMMGLYRCGENDHPSNMRLVWQALGRLGDLARTRPWVSMDRYVPSEGGTYQFFVGVEMFPCEDALPGLHTLEVETRNEAHINFFGSFEELWQGSYAKLWCHVLPEYGLRTEPSMWKRAPSAPISPDTPLSLQIPLAA